MPALTWNDFSDQLDPRLDYKSSVLTIDGAEGDNQLVADYYAFTKVNGKLTWVLSESGLAKLKANHGKTLSVTLVTPSPASPLATSPRARSLTAPPSASTTSRRPPRRSPTPTGAT